VTVRAIRGAIQVGADDRDAILEGTAELVTAVMTRNDLTPDDVISVLFTVTPDLTAEFPALAARKLGFHAVPLMCATEIPAWSGSWRTWTPSAPARRSSTSTCAARSASARTSPSDGRRQRPKTMIRNGCGPSPATVMAPASPGEAAR